MIFTAISVRAQEIPDGYRVGNLDYYNKQFLYGAGLSVTGASACLMSMAFIDDPNAGPAKYVLLGTGTACSIMGVIIQITAYKRATKQRGLRLDGGGIVYGF